MSKIRDYQLTSNQMSDHQDDEGQHGVLLETAKPQLKKPFFYQVVVLNDDYTPMDFVVEVLEQFFGMNIEKATQIMLAIHHEGKAVAGVYPKDIAETKAQQVIDFARAHEHPLMCLVEQKSD
ncbi:ATP-dependent Clp protease adapter ClpS [Agitococcus lubricus]|uniref:ATP-dependent Clp protease adapter protein ClpS n=1 Tax=Agitococcus lubricus TaxID=1077255 RepID=A0A2T5IYR8_9GAMM|nr:ATP-dependent Clp protease adapter ClpS [Agitococcus lubricus]PTQ89158.1 ATP-dependent Clp protease adaptor protein ClpS [Agitococcus lubricus]